MVFFAFKKNKADPVQIYFRGYIRFYKTNVYFRNRQISLFHFLVFIFKQNILFIHVQTIQTIYKHSLQPCSMLRFLVGVLYYLVQELEYSLLFGLGAGVQFTIWFRSRSLVYYLVLKLEYSLLFGLGAGIQFTLCFRSRSTIYYLVLELEYSLLFG